MSGPNAERVDREMYAEEPNGEDRTAETYIAFLEGLVRELAAKLDTESAIRQGAAAALGRPGPKARRTDPSTSHQAAAANLPRRDTQQRRIVEYLVKEKRRMDELFRGRTAEHLHFALDLRLNSVSTRLSELEGAWVQVVGEENGKSLYAPTEKALAAF